jgi:hypothetical protein
MAFPICHDGEDGVAQWSGTGHGGVAQLPSRVPHRAMTVALGAADMPNTS